jgi:integrase
MGSIRQTPGGNWQARFRDPAGKTRGKTFKRKVDARKFLERVEADKQRGDYLDPRAGKLTVGQVADEWYATTVGLKPKTRAGYESILRVHIRPPFGTVQLVALDQLQVRAFLAHLVEQGAGPALVRNAYRVLSMVCQAAVAKGAIRVNPCKGVRLPKAHRPEMHALTAADVERLATVIGEPWVLLVRFAAYTGLRAGEIGALRVGRLDLRAHRVEVAESVTDVNGYLHFGATKTYERRTVRLPKLLSKELRAYLGDRLDQPHELVFTGPEGGPLRHHWFYRRHFKPAVLRAGLPSEVRFHDLRHTCASLLIAKGASVKAVQKQLGHKSAVVTLDTYGHLFPDEMDRLAAALDATYRAARNGAGRSARSRKVA